MTDHDPNTPDAPDAAGEDIAGERIDKQPASRVIFAIAALGFLVFLVIGTIEARIWRFGRLYFEDRGVREVWSYFGDRLPDMPGQPVITALYWVSVAVLIAGTVVGLWLFLGTQDDEPARDALGNDASATSNHA